MKISFTNFIYANIMNFKEISFSLIRQLYNIFQQLTQTPSFVRSFTPRFSSVICCPCEWKVFTTCSAQMQWWRHMTTCDLQLSTFIILHILLPHFQCIYTVGWASAISSGLQTPASASLKASFLIPFGPTSSQCRKYNQLNKQEVKVI